MNRHSKKHRAAMVSSIAVLVTTLSACGTRHATVFDYHRVDSRAEAGSTHVAVQMIAPWEQYVDAMSANFSMDEKTALASVLPSTLLFTRKVLDANQVGVRLAPPTSSTSLSRTTSVDAEGKETTISEQTQKKDPGDVSKVTPEAGIAGDRTAGGIAGIDLVKEDLDSDPFLKHQVALALKQEVALLNRQAKNAALRHGMVPYIIRMQISLMPNARRQPYDTDVYTSIFYRDGYEKVGDTPLKTPYVMPMLVSDNLEAALQSRSIDQLRKRTFALNLLFKGFGANLDAQRFNEQFENAFGRDMNSLMTVSRASDNTLRARLGAQLTPSSQYAMVTRHHYISFVLLVDERYARHMEEHGMAPTMALVTRTDMTDAEKGDKLRNRTALEIQDALDAIRTDFGIPEYQATALRGLVPMMQRNQYAEFMQQAKQLINSPEALWASLVGLMNGASFQSASFDLPKLPTMELDTQQALLLADNGTHTEVALRGSNLVTKQLSATLDFQNYSLSSGSAKVQGDTLTLQFPSLAQWGLVTAKDNEAQTCDGSVKLKVSAVGKSWTTSVGIAKSLSLSFSQGKRSQTSGGTKCRYLKISKKPAKTAASFSINNAVGVLLSNKGKGSLKLSVKIEEVDKRPATEHIVITLEGADVGDFTGEGVTKLTGNRIKVTKTTDIVLNLSRLQPGFQVTVKAADKDEKTRDSFSLPIVGVS